MVRLIMVAQSSLHNDMDTFSQIVFASTSKSYSKDSLQEIKEELRALYTAEEINDIISCFTGYRTSFSVRDLQKRINQYFSETVLKTKFRRVIEDLYRLGFLGNFLPASQIYHWQHKGDASVILSDEWRLCVHYALHDALSIGARNDRVMRRDAQVGDIAKATVYDVISHFVLVDFKLFGTNYKGSIHISEFGNHGYGYIRRLSDIVHDGDQFDVSLINYNAKFSNWKLRLLSEKNV